MVAEINAAGAAAGAAVGAAAGAAVGAAVGAAAGDLVPSSRAAPAHQIASAAMYACSLMKISHGTAAAEAR